MSADSARSPTRTDPRPHRAAKRMSLVRRPRRNRISVSRRCLAVAPGEQRQSGGVLRPDLHPREPPRLAPRVVAACRRLPQAPQSRPPYRHARDSHRRPCTGSSGVADGTGAAVSGPGRVATGLWTRPDEPLDFRFDGRALRGLRGDTLASALLANGVRLVGRSFKYHRPRGIVTAGPEEPNALVGLRGGGRAEPNTRATMVELYDALEAVSQNRFPSLGFDIVAAASLVA